MYFGKYFPTLVRYSKKNLATLIDSGFQMTRKKWAEKTVERSSCGAAKKSTASFFSSKCQK
jgi:hypothetical protein